MNNHIIFKFIIGDRKMFEFVLIRNQLIKDFTKEHTTVVWDNHTINGEMLNIILSKKLNKTPCIPQSYVPHYQITDMSLSTETTEKSRDVKDQIVYFNNLDLLS